MENPLRYVKLLPLQGDRFAFMITQGAALGYELLPFQGVLIMGVFSPCQTGRADYRGFQPVPNVQVESFLL